jgi:hypothetical protein
MKKAGNLRHGHERSDGEFIAIFDADFCPRRDAGQVREPMTAPLEHMGVSSGPAGR